MGANNILTDLLLQLGPITPILDDAVATAIGNAEQRCAGIPHNPFSYLRPSVVRAEARLQLEEVPLPEGWELAGNPARQGQLIIRKRGVMDLRFLKANPVQPGLIPHAGSNKARRAAWLQDPLVDGWTTGISQTFLLLWNYLDARQRSAGFSLRLVHPIEAGGLGHRVPSDLDVEIPTGGTSFEGLTFRGDEDPVDFFTVEIDHGEELDQ